MYRLIDEATVLKHGVHREAASALFDAVIGEIQLTEFQILDTLVPERDDVAKETARLAKVAAARRRRADGLAAKAGVSGRDLFDMRLEVVLRLNAAEERQVMLEEKLANLDLYAVSPEEANSSGHSPNLPAPQTREQIELDAIQGRAHVTALAGWLDDNPGPAPKNHPDPTLQRATELLRKWLGVADNERTTKPDTNDHAANANP